MTAAVAAALDRGADGEPRQPGEPAAAAPATREGGGTRWMGGAVA
jgi:hypothetical protein